VDRRRFLLTSLAGVLAAPHAAEAQQAGKVWRIGWLNQGSAEGASDALAVFRQALNDLGYADARDYSIEVRSANGQTDRLPGLARQLAFLPVDVLVAISTPGALAASRVTETTPIVMVTVADPVGTGLVKSFSRPGRNVTGTALALDEVSRKWLELLKTVRGGLARVAALHNSTNRSMPAMLAPLELSARKLNVSVRLYDVRDSETLSKAFDAIATSHADGLIVLPDSFLQDQRARISGHVSRLRLPAIYATRRDVEDGGLRSYGPNFLENHRRAANYVDKIFKGAKPSELPIERPMKFDLVINLKTAKALGLTIPRSLLLRADQVIE